MQIIKPMLAKLSGLPTQDAEYGFEIKWDGMRAVLYCQDGHIQLLSRNQRDVTAQYPELAGLGVAAAKQQFILDGEIVHFDTNGKPSFSGLQHRMGVSSAKSVESRRQVYPVTYVIFDLLSLQGETTLHLSYTVRREMLAKLQLEGSAWQTPAYQLGSGQEILAAACRIGLEGIVAKRLASLYAPGERTGDWLKIKNQQSQELVIGGWAAGNGSRQGKIGALLLGYYDALLAEGKKHNQPQQLHYAGKVGTGFTIADLEYLGSLLEPLATSHNPFSIVPPVKNAAFVKPVLVGEFEFTEWTPNDTLRHPVFKGLRTDKPAGEVVRES